MVPGSGLCSAVDSHWDLGLHFPLIRALVFPFCNTGDQDHNVGSGPASGFGEVLFVFLCFEVLMLSSTAGL